MEKHNQQYLNYVKPVFVRCMPVNNKFLPYIMIYHGIKLPNSIDKNFIEIPNHFKTQIWNKLYSLN